MVVWCHDWPVVAAGGVPHEPAAVLHANRVVACSPAAGAEGVRVGLRRREAQGRSPTLAIFDHD
jgi:protein ImuB